MSSFLSNFSSTDLFPVIYFILNFQKQNFELPIGKPVLIKGHETYSQKDMLKLGTVETLKSAIFTQFTIAFTSIMFGDVYKATLLNYTTPKIPYIGQMNGMDLFDWYIDCMQLYVCCCLLFLVYSNFENAIRLEFEQINFKMVFLSLLSFQLLYFNNLWLEMRVIVYLMGLLTAFTENSLLEAKNFNVLRFKKGCFTALIACSLIAMKVRSVGWEQLGMPEAVNEKMLEGFVGIGFYLVCASFE